jgi:hypothetical protein
MVSLREFARGSDRPQTMTEIISEEDMYQGDHGNTREFIEKMRGRIEDMKTEKGGIAVWRRLKPRPPKTIMEEAQVVSIYRRQCGPGFVATLNEDGSITEKPIIGYVEEDYPRDQPKPRQGTPEYYKREAMPVTGKHCVKNPGRISDEQWNDAGRKCTNLYRRYIGEKYRYLIKDIEHGDIDGMESELYHCSRKNNPKRFGKRLTERIEQMPLNIAEAQRGLCDHLQVFKELEEYVDGNSDPKVKHSYIKMTEEDFVSCFINKLRPHLPHMTDIFDTAKRKGKDWNIKKLQEFIDRFENNGWLKTEREDIVQLEGEEVAQLKAENANLKDDLGWANVKKQDLKSELEEKKAENHGLWKSNDQLKQAQKELHEQKEEEKQESQHHREQQQQQQPEKKTAAIQSRKKELKREKKRDKDRHRKERTKERTTMATQSKRCRRGGAREASDLQNPYKWSPPRNPYKGYHMKIQQQVQQVDTAEHDRKDEEQQEQPEKKKEKKKRKCGKANKAASHRRRQAKRQKEAQTRCHSKQ